MDGDNYAVVLKKNMALQVFKLDDLVTRENKCIDYSYRCL